MQRLQTCLRRRQILGGDASTLSLPRTLVRRIAVDGVTKRSVHEHTAQNQLFTQGGGYQVCSGLLAPGNWRSNDHRSAEVHVMQKLWPADGDEHDVVTRPRYAFQELWDAG